MPTIEKTYHRWVVVCSVDSTEARERIVREVLERLGAAHIREAVPALGDVLVVSSTNEAASMIQTMPFVEHCEAAPVEFNLYHFELKPELSGSSDQYTSRLLFMLNEQLLEQEFDLALNDIDGFWAFTSDRCARFVSGLDQVQRATKWVNNLN